MRSQGRLFPRRRERNHSSDSQLPTVIDVMGTVTDWSLLMSAPIPVSLAALERDPPRRSYLVAPNGYCRASAPDAEAPIFKSAPQTVYANAKSRLENDPGFEDVTADDGEHQIRAVAVTRVLRFKDDIIVEVLPADEGASTLVIYSRSRVGYGDLRTNRNRVEALIRDLRQDLMLGQGEGGVTQRDPGRGVSS